MARSLTVENYYHRMWGQLSTTCSNVLKQPTLLNSEVDLQLRLKVDWRVCWSSNGVIWRQNVHTILDFKLLLAYLEGFTSSTTIYLNHTLYLPKTQPNLRWPTLETLVAYLKYLSKKNYTPRVYSLISLVRIPRMTFPFIQHFPTFISFLF